MTETNEITAIANIYTEDIIPEGVNLVEIKSELVLENHLADLIAPINEFCDRVENVPITEDTAKDYRKARTKLRKMTANFNDYVAGIKTAVLAGYIDFENDAKNIKKRLDAADKHMKEALDSLKENASETPTMPSEDAKLYRLTYIATGTKEQLVKLRNFMEQEGIQYEDYKPFNARKDN